jgi:pantoate--beta-alanine ligase
MSDTVPVLPTIAALRAQVRVWRAAGDTIALVPTMGALHAGHLALVAAGQSRATRTVASIFVNPAQFAPGEDFTAYPRTMESDLAKLAGQGADACFAPGVADMYAPGFSTTVTVGGASKADLEDHTRPTHFAGVVTVVCKLLNQTQPDFAMFGEKDYQQLMVVSAMVRDLDLPVEIIGVPTVREQDGLALSSRNVYLTPEERAVAPALHRALSRCAAAIREGEVVGHAMVEATETIVGAGFKIDYLEARHAETLARVARRADGPIRLLVAARIGKTRLIDNLAV